MSKTTSVRSADRGTRHHHKHSSQNKVLRAVTFVLTPFLILVISTSLVVIALTKPYEEFKPYADFVFNKENSYDHEAKEKRVNKYRDDDAPLQIKKVKDSQTGEDHDIIYPYYGDYYGTINCKPAGMKDIPFYSGDGDDILQQGAGWFNGSSFVGHVGNVVICAHNHTYFLNLPNCKVGDEVVLETDFVKQTYIVTQKEVFYKTDLTYVRPTDDDRLTMYTCWNNGRLGMSDYRLAVVCELTKREWKEVSSSK